MNGWVWVVIVALIVIVLLSVAYAAWQKRRSTSLQSQFGPEYDRAVGQSDSRRQAEKDLEERQKRREELNIRELEPATRDRHMESWRQTQARFVDAPAEAVRDADRLVGQVMTDRGYPMDNFDQRSADISVDHPDVVENYRAAHGISLASDHGQATTEDLRQAMVHYRSLFETLLGTTGPESSQRFAQSPSDATGSGTGYPQESPDTGGVSGSIGTGFPQENSGTATEAGGVSQTRSSAYPESAEETGR
jgi:hypothetical protein